MNETLKRILKGYTNSAEIPQGRYKGIASPTHRSDAEMVKEIHDTFFTEVNRLLADARIAHDTSYSEPDRIKKANKLKDLGFINAKEVIDAGTEVRRVELLELENIIKKSIVAAIDYFSMHYPNYKFITEQAVKGICQTYGLVYGPVHKYKGTVPDKNLEHMLKFAIKDEDKAYIMRTSYSGSNWWDTIINHTYYQKMVKSNEDIKQQWSPSASLSTLNSSISYMPSPMEIAGPVSDFQMDKQEIKDFQLQDKPSPPDPVVLQPVWFEGMKHYLIVTAWGPEAADRDVVNEKMN